MYKKVELVMELKLYKERIQWINCNCTSWCDQRIDGMRLKIMSATVKLKVSGSKWDS